MTKQKVPRNSQMNIRLSTADITAIYAAAARRGVSGSEWARTLLLHAAGRPSVVEDAVDAKADDTERYNDPR